MSRCLHPQTPPEDAFKGVQLPSHKVFGGFWKTRVRTYKQILREWLRCCCSPQVLIQLEGSKKPPFGLRLTDFFRRLDPEKCSWQLRSSRITLRHGWLEVEFFVGFLWVGNFKGHPKGNFYLETCLPWKFHTESNKMEVWFK